MAVLSTREKLEAEALGGIKIRGSRFVLSSVLRVANVQHQRLTSERALNWVKAGYLQAASIQQPGSGNRRRYSAIDVLAITALFHLTNIGVTPSDAALCLPLISDRMKARASNIGALQNDLAKLGEFRLYVVYSQAKDELLLCPLHDNETGAEADRRRKVLRDSPAYICISVDSIINQVVAELGKIVAEQEREERTA
jgi:hypothetical protein